MDFDYRKLKGRIKEKFDTQEKFADALGIGRTTISQRLSNKSEFSQEEIKRSCDLLKIPPELISEYFFTLLV